MMRSLAELEWELQEWVRPRASELDRNPNLLKEAFQWLGARSLLALKLPTEWNGGAVEVIRFQQFQELLARYSGALAFLQTQHQSAGSILLRSDNEALKQAYLPDLGNGNKTLGVGFSHLRRQGKPPVVARSVHDGYEITGVVPWITGFGVFQDFIVAAVIEGDVNSNPQAVYGIVPFVNAQQPEGGQIQLSEPMPLAAMRSTATVTANLQSWFLPHTQVVALIPADAIHISDRVNVLQHSFFALGCARAGLDVVLAASQSKGLPFIQAVYDQLDQELQQCRAAIFSAENLPYEQRLDLRGWAIALAARCAQAAIAVSGGAANQIDHPAQRIYREALVYTVAGQTQSVMAATLNHLCIQKTC